MSAKKIFLKIFAAALLIAASLLLSLQLKSVSLFPANLFASIQGQLNDFGKALPRGDLLQKNVDGPSANPLSVGGIVDFTNQERLKNNLPALKFNALLSQSADDKSSDMLALQYFSHDSPSGISAGTLISNAGYQYITVGENLALGNFDGDLDLVAAWMGSPGHRANILNKSYTEIGVSAIQGIFEGRKVWLAVQHFGTPQSACAKPDPETQNNILANKKQIVSLQDQIEELKTQINGLHDLGQSGDKLINLHNQKIMQAKELVKSTQKLIINYNASIDQYNSCVKQYQ